MTNAILAFTLRPREFEAYEISSKGPKEPKGSKESKENELGSGSYKCHIPHYRVDDSSSVTVVETKNAFEKSLADSSFTEGSFQAAGYEFWPLYFPCYVAHLHLAQWAWAQSREVLKEVEEAAARVIKGTTGRRRKKR